LLELEKSFKIYIEPQNPLNNESCLEQKEKGERGITLTDLEIYYKAEVI
jgi:hypothetical protein